MAAVPSHTSGLVAVAVPGGQSARYCFDPAVFERRGTTPAAAGAAHDATTTDDPGFDVSEFVSEHSRLVPLETLREDLSRFVRDTKAKLVAHINTDYANFVELSARLEGFESAVAPLQQPLYAVRDRAIAAQEAAHQELARMQGAVAARDAVVHRRKTLERFVAAHELAVQTDRVLARITRGESASAPDAAADTATLEADDGVPPGSPTGRDGGLTVTEDDEERCLLLERAARSCRQLESILQHYGVDTSDSGDRDSGSGTDGRGPLFLRMLLLKLRSSRSALRDKLRDMLLYLLRVAAASSDDDDDDDDDGVGGGSGGLAVDDVDGAAASAGGDGVARNVAQAMLASALEPCLRSLALCGAGSIAESAFAEAAVDPFLAETFTQGRLDDGARGSYRGVPAAFDAYLAFAASPSVRNVVAAADSTRGMDMLCNVLWRRLVRVLLDKFPGLFSAGIARAFHANFTAFGRLFERFSQLFEAVAPRGAAGLRTHRATVEIEDKWARSLPVYFQLRSSELRETVEAALQREADASLGSSGDSRLSLAASAAVWSALLRCWASDVVVPALATRFLRLTMQAVGRYHAWLGAAFAPRAHKGDASAAAAAAAGAGSNAAGAGSAAAVAASGPASAPAASRTAGAGGASGGGSGSAGAGDDTVAWSSASPDAVLAAGHDARVMRDLIQTELVATVRTRLGTALADAADVAAAALVEAATALDDVEPRAMAVVAQRLASRCSKSLGQNVRGIPATYRMTSKPVPKSHSPFIDNVFKPLRTFLRSHEAQMPPSAPTTRAWAGGIAHSVATDYCAMVEGLLETVTKMDASLKWLKNSGSAGSGGDVSDSDKIRVQVLCDVRRFCADAEHLGADVAADGHGDGDDGGGGNPFVALNALVEPAAPLLPS